MKKSFLIHKDSLVVLDDLTDQQCGELFRAIKAHHFDDDLSLSPIVKIAFSPFKNQFIRDHEKYESTCKARADAGSMGGKQKVANASKCKQKVANVAENDNDNKKESEKENKTKPAKEDYTTPAFEYFWNQYPRKIGKKKSLQKFTLLTKSKDKDSIKTLVNKIANDIQRKIKTAVWLPEDEPEYIPHPSTYLNSETWLDNE